MGTHPYHRISANAATWERRLLNGRPHWVGPASMIVPGVLNGSKGPLLYPADEIIRSVPAWNGMPITVGHPKDERGNYTSARQPGILDKHQLGQVFSANYDGRLSAEAWLDEALVAKRLPEVLNAIKEGRHVELSTGLKTDDEEAPGVYNNSKTGESRPYTHIARNYQPDHLAILVGQRGACSVADGCGLGVNLGMCPECGEDSPDCECERTDDAFKHPKDLTGNVLMRMWKATLNAFLPNQPRSLATGRIKGMNAGQGKGEGHEAAQQGYYGSLPNHVKPGTEDDEESVVNYIREEGGKFCVYSEDGKKLGEHEIKAEAEAQLRAIEASKHSNNNEEGDNMPRKENVAFLVANCDCWKTKGAVLNDAKLFSDAEVEAIVQREQLNTANALVVNSVKEAAPDLALNAMPAFIKEKIKAKEDPDEDDEDEDEEEETTNRSKQVSQQPKRMTYNEWAAIAPPEVVERDRQAQFVLKREMGILVNQLTKHISDPAAKAARIKKLSTLNLDQLQERVEEMKELVGNGVGVRPETEERPYFYPSQFIANGGSMAANAWESYDEKDLPPEPGARREKQAA